METMNTAQVAALLGIKEETFSNQRKRSEERLRQLGNIFTTEGRGKNTLYHFTVITKETKQMSLAKNWEKHFGFKPQRPYVAISYFYYLTHEPLGRTKTDADVAFDILGSKELRPVITMARNDLTKAGFLKPLSATEFHYRLSTPDGKMLEGKEAEIYWAGAWHSFYTALEITAEEMAMMNEGYDFGWTEKGIEQTAGECAWQEMKSEWGTPSRIKTRELTGKQMIDIKEL